MLHTDLIAPIPDLLRRHAAARGDKIAYRDAQTAVTYAALLERTGNLAGHLADHRHRAGRHGRDHAAELGAMGGELLRHRARRRDQRADQLRLHRSGNRLSAGRRRLQSGDHDRRARRSVRAAASVRAESQDADRRPIAAKPARRRLRYETLATSPPKSAPRDPASLHETAFILYTSGTTGRAKGVQLTVHGMLWIVAACWAPITGLSERDTLLSPLPLFHSYALNLPGARHPRHRRDLPHHGAVLDQRGGAAAQDRRVHLLPRRADDVPLSAAGDARRSGLALSQPAASASRPAPSCRRRSTASSKAISACRCSTATASPKPRPW